MKVYIINIFITTLLLLGCTPAPFNTEIDASTDNNQEAQDPTDVGSENNYFQLSSVTSQGTLSFNKAYSDSFLIRGNNIHNFLLSNESTDSICLVTRFNSVNPNKVIALAARKRSNFNYALNVTEFFLQVEPNNLQANQNDCQNANLLSFVQDAYGINTIEYQTEVICPTCTSPLQSDEIQILQSAQLVTAVNTPNMRLNLLVNSTSTDTDSGNQNSCTEDSACSASGFNCCLQNQCVNHAAVRNGVDTSDPAFASAQAQVISDPSQVVNYPNFYYICPSFVDTDGDGSTDDNTNPNQPNEEFTRFQELYECMNPVQDEYAVCTKIFENAAQLLSANNGAYTFTSSNSDITFRNISANINYNNIKEITYGEVPMYKDQELNLDPSFGVLGDSNDTLNEAQFVTLNSLITGNINDKLKLKYRVDASCKKLNAQLAQCTKSYVQGQLSTPPRTTDHPASQAFNIPAYADMSYNLLVKVGGATVPPGTSTWVTSGTTVIFNSTTNQIFPNQKVDITYFVTSNIDQLTQAKEEAQNEVNQVCSCTGDAVCYLQPIHENPLDETTPVVSYSCQVEGTDPVEPPLQKTFYISSKTVAHKFFDISGTYYKYDDLAARKQECAQSFGVESNCTAFNYESNDKNKPNNVSQYIGFNEITGSFNSGNSPAIPATELDVIKGRTYDIFADEGLFSTCDNCGTDYYSSLVRLFPDNFTYKGGGYLPNMVESRRIENQSNFNADDMKFGRACFVPPTMIPWTHTVNGDVKTQRRQRLMAQHFMFANGYNKDWYGFDYGSIIASFDGVTWFSVGNQRNILAKSNKLYLAINAILGDETLNNSFRITVNEVVPIANSGSLVTHDTLSDGAQCQLAHYCETDNDCLANLGYDYACESVGALRTPWPKFDDNANEISGQTVQSILSLVGGANGQAKRCVYRGRGSLCSQNPSTVNANDSYTDSVKKSLHSCSANTFCAALNTANFNNRIARYGKTLNSQNNQTFISDKTDLFGMDARVIGRPYNFFGTELANINARNQLTLNNVEGMCVPGKNIQSATTQDQLNATDPIINKADINFEMGRTFETLTQNENYFGACTALDDNNNFTYKVSTSDLSLDSNLHKPFAISQNLSTNSFQLNSLVSSNIFNDETPFKEAVGYDKNSCLRAPGASCFTDLDCSVNSWVSSKFKNISDFNGEINEAEIDFWKEDLVCATSQERYPAGGTLPNINYASNLKKCCREIDKTFTFYSQKNSGDSFKATEGGQPAIPGVNVDLNDPMRYSRIHTIYDLLSQPGDSYPSLVVPNENNTGAPQNLQIENNSYRNQYKTLNAHNQRMCCTGSWVREFANGGHRFDGQTGQNFSGANLSIFKNLNWLPDTDGAVIPFSCTLDNADTSACELRNIVEGSSYEQKWLDYFSKFELTGIPQIYIESHKDGYNKIVEIDQSATPLPFKPIGPSLSDDTGLLATGSDDGVVAADVTSNGKEYFSAASVGDSSSKYDSSTIKKVFSEKSFACCMPTGTQVADSVTNESCCTGQVTDQNGPRRCCLNDYADLSVYTNRYVSSEGANFNGQQVSDSDVDRETGYIRKELVKQMGATMCCSGRAEYGVAISDLYIPLGNGTFNPNLTKRRFIENDNIDNDSSLNGPATYFGFGRKWNNHVYCVPTSAP